MTNSESYTHAPWLANLQCMEESLKSNKNIYKEKTIDIKWSLYKRKITKSSIIPFQKAD